MTSTIQSFLGNQYRTYLVLFLCALIIGIKLGTLIPLLSLILESRGYSNTEIGLNVVAQPLAVILFVRITPIIIHKIGLARSIVIAQIFTILLYFTFPIFESLTAWFIIRFLIGFAGALAWNAFDTWMLSMADDSNRGKIVTIYNTVFVIGFAIGPMVISLTGIEGWLPFVVIAALSFLAIIPLITIKIDDPKLPEKKSLPVFAAIIAAPTIFGAAILCGLDDVMFVSFFPIFMIKSNFSQDLALQFVTITLVGGVICQPIVGVLLDKVNKRLLMNIAVLITFICPIIFALFINNFYIMAISCFMWGGAASGIFAISLTMLGERYSASQVAGATAILVMVFEVGSLTGPLIGGRVMDIVGPMGFIYTITSFTFIFLVISIYRTFRR
jgi:MFS family permease|tara:strand:+ start:1008 stop:2165 length:1158 start_codon:yes stop_codon:yes gene_type:complete